MIFKFKTSKFIFWTGILLVQFFVFWIISQSSTLVNGIIYFFKWQKKNHQYLFSNIKFSVGDVFYCFIGLVFIYLIFKYLITKKSIYLTRIAVLFNCIYFIYQIFWGVLYHNQPIVKQLEQSPITDAEIKQNIQKYLNECKVLRAQLTQNEKGILEIKHLGLLKQTVVNQQYKLPKNLFQFQPTECVSIKPSLFSFVMSETGILGYYNPFTAEAQYNSNLPDSLLGFTLLHETAHQLGYAREQEASFVGYVVGLNSNNKYLEYSAKYYFLKSLINSIYTTDPKYYQNALSQFSPQMKNDRANERAFFDKHQGLLNTLFTFTNDLFLRSNGQDGRISYSYFTELAIRYQRIR